MVLLTKIGNMLGMGVGSRFLVTEYAGQFETLSFEGLVDI